MRKLATIALVAAACGSALRAQTSINGGRVISGAWDASGAVTTKPAKTGTTLPAACSAGEQFFKTDASAGQNLYLCTAANTWTQMAGTGGGGGTGNVSGGTSLVTPGRLAYVTGTSTIGEAAGATWDATLSQVRLDAAHSGPALFSHLHDNLAYWGLTMGSGTVAPFSMYSLRNNYASGKYQDLFRIGYNLNPSTDGKIVSSEAEFHWGMESNYNGLFEVNWDFIPADNSITRRYLGFSVDRTTHKGTWGLSGDELYFSDSDENRFLRFTPATGMEVGGAGVWKLAPSSDSAVGIRSLTAARSSSLAVMPNGAPTGSTKSSLSLYRTDYYADQTNYELLSFQAGDRFVIASQAGGTGQVRDLVLGNSQFVVRGSGRLSIGADYDVTDHRITLDGTAKLVRDDGGPAYLTIEGSSGQTAYLLEAHNSSGNTVMRLKPTGEVQVQGNNGWPSFFNQGTNFDWDIEPGDSGRLTLAQSGAKVLVGTNTASGTEKVQVTGAARFTSTVDASGFKVSGTAGVDKICSAAPTAMTVSKGIITSVTCN